MAQRVLEKREALKLYSRNDKDIVSVILGNVPLPSEVRELIVESLAVHRYDVVRVIAIHHGIDERDIDEVEDGFALDDTHAERVMILRSFCEWNSGVDIDWELF